MARIEVTKAVSLNLRGYDREVVALEVGVHDVSDEAAEWFERNPEYGQSVDDDEEERELDIEEMSRDELVALAEERGVAVRAKATKPALVEALQESEADDDTQPVDDDESDGEPESDEEGQE